MNRYFVSITLPVDLQKSIDQILPESRSWRKTDRSHLHLTLRYIGGTDDAAVKNIEGELAKIDLPEFTLSLKEIGFFPEKGRIRVIWIGVEKSSTLMELQSLADIAVSDVLKIESEYLFTPHITLARVKRKVKKEEVLSVMPEFDKVLECKVNSFQLMESRQEREGVEHLPVKNYQLKTE